MANLLIYRLVGEGVDREVEVDEVVCNGYFIMTRKGNVNELIPGHVLSSATVLPVEEEDGES